jgi:hypothetical protein
MYSACPVEPANTAAVDAAPLIPTPNGTAPLLTRLRPLPDASETLDRFHNPAGALSPSAVKSATAS